MPNYLIYKHPLANEPDTIFLHKQQFFERYNFDNLHTPTYGRRQPHDFCWRDIERNWGNNSHIQEISIQYTR